MSDPWKNAQPPEGPRSSDSPVGGDDDPPTEGLSARDGLFAQLGAAPGTNPLTPQRQPPEQPASGLGAFNDAAAGSSGEIQPPETSKFGDLLFRITPRVYATRLIVLANILVFAAMVGSTGALFSPKAQTLVAWGANFGPETLMGQWWRLLTCMFIHVGLLHIAFNMWVLWGLGHLVERLVGNAGYLALYFLSGLGGSVASVAWNPDAVSAGASGAVFGVLGSLMGFVLLRRDSVPKDILSQLKNSGGMFLAYNLLFGLSVEAIDMAAHLGGLICGFFCGLLMSQPLERVTPRRRLYRNLLTVALAGGALAAGSYAALGHLARFVNEWRAFDAMEAATLTSLKQARDDWRLKKLSASEFADRVEREVLVPWRAAHEKLISRGRPPWRLAQKHELQLQYAGSRQREWELLIAAIRENDSTKMDAYQQQMLATRNLAEQIRNSH